jgi:hypothetical protein
MCYNTKTNTTKKWKLIVEVRYKGQTFPGWLCRYNVFNENPFQPV